MNILRSILSLSICCMLFTCSVFAYVPSAQDQALLQSLDTKIEQLKKSNPQKLEKIGKKLEKILTIFDENSREYYVLDGIHTMIVGEEDIVGTIINEILSEGDAVSEYNDEEDSEHNKSKKHIYDGARCKVLFVVDGDTLQLKCNNREYQISLLGVDAPEMGDTWADDAKIYLTQYIQGKDVVVSFDEGSTVEEDENIYNAYLSYRGKDIGLMVIISGYAQVSSDEGYEKQSMYQKEYENARGLYRGMWSDEKPTGSTAKKYSEYAIEADRSSTYSSTGGSCGSRTLHVGSRGGCYYYNSNGNKSYVDRSCCW